MTALSVSSAVTESLVGTVPGLRFNSEQAVQVPAEYDFLLRIRKEVGVDHEVHRVRPQERLVGSVDDLVRAHLRNEVS